MNLIVCRQGAGGQKSPKFCRRHLRMAHLPTNEALIRAHFRFVATEGDFLSHFRTAAAAAAVTILLSHSHRQLSDRKEGGKVLKPDLVSPNPRGAAKSLSPFHSPPTNI